MTPFQEFRYWLRRAPVRERLFALLATAVVLGLLAYVVVPSSSGSSTFAGNSLGTNATGATGQAAPTTVGGSRVTAASGAGTGGSTTGIAGGSGGGAATGVGSQSGASGNASGTVSSNVPAARATTGPGSRGCVSPPGSDQGVTATTVKVAVILVDVGGSATNSLFNVPPPNVQQQYYQDIVDYVNASGGVACRKIVPQFFDANPLDQGGLHQVCLSVAQAHPFFVMDLGAYFLFTPLATCFPQSHLPFVSSALMSNREKEQYYPYLFGQAIGDVVYRNTVFALNQRGFFSAGSGFRKLGFVYRSCDSSIISEMKGALSQVGISGSKLVTYDLGCPNGFASPSALEQAVLNFQRARVTNVTTAEMAVDFGNFTNIAQQQHFVPKYGLAQDSIVPTTYTAAHGNFTNITNAIAITPDRYGEERTPGTTPSAGTVWCNKIFAAHHVVPVYKQAENVGGGACDEVQLFVGALSHAPAVQRTALAAGLAASRSIDFSFPFGPSRFTGTHPMTGGQFWRVLQFHRSCNCWQLLDRTFHPSF